MNPDPFEQRAQELAPKDPFEVRAEERDPFFQRSIQKSVIDRTLYGALKRGYQSGVTGLAAGYEPAEAPEDASLLERVSQGLGTVASDVPAIAAGSFAGGVLGSFGGPIGTAVGAGAGGFAVPEIIKESFAQYRDYVKKGNDLTFGEFLERAGKVGKAGAKSAIIGGAAGSVSRFLPALSKTDWGKNLLSTRLSRGVAKGAEVAAEAGAITGTSAALEGELPTQQEFIDNLATLWATKLAHKAESKLRKSFSKPEKAAKITQPIEEKVPEEVSETKEPIPESEKPIKVSEYSLETLEDIKDNRPLSESEQARYEELTKPSTKGETLTETRVEKDIKSPEPLDKSWIDIASSFLPENVKEKGHAIVEKLPEPIKKLGGWAASLRKSGRQKIFFSMLEDHIGKRNARMVESQFKWREALENVEKEGKLSKEAREEMIYYRQRTPNPNKPGDTFEELSKRIPEKAKHLVDDIIDKHFKETLKEYNENPFTKDINPRDGLADIYLTGLYEDHPKNKRVYEEVSKQFKTKNPLSNEKVFLTYYDALTKAGLKPRYKDIIEVVKAYDNIMNKSIANQELIRKIREIEKVNGEKLIVNSIDEENYGLAKSLGYVPFDDVYLRRYVAGEKDGKPIWATTAAPALVHPDFASAFQGVFRKDAYKPEHPFFKAYDAIADTLRFTRVSLSPFHFGALLEHGVPALGLRAFNMKGWSEEGRELRNNKEWMKTAVESGLKIESKAEQDPFKKGESLIDKGLELIPEKMGDVDISKGINKVRRFLNYLFDQFHPNLKAVSWQSYVDAEIGKRIKEGHPPSELEIKQIRRDVAKFINDMYGGQNWETQRVFNNPNTMKWLRRAIGYPDWTVSAIKQGVNFFQPGLKGKAARRWWYKYGIYYALTQGLIRYISSGFEQTDKKNKSIGGIRWNPVKAKNNLLDKDPTAWWKFPLPDVDVKIAGRIFNPGRDDKQRKLYAHFGKQALELGHWATNPFDELFAKANPLLQIAYKQLMGSTPYKEKDFKVRGKNIGGEIQPWDATKPWTTDRLVSRGKEIISDISPFGLRTWYEKGTAPYVASGFGSIPISKGMTLEKAGSYIEDAIKNKDVKSLNEIRKLLKENGYEDKSINARITRIRNRMEKEKKPHSR